MDREHGLNLEGLHPDLRDSVFRFPDLGMPGLHHPLVVDIPFIAQEPVLSHINAFYEQKLAQLAEPGNSPMRIVNLHERPYRLDKALDLIDEGACESEAEEAELLLYVWTDAEPATTHYEDDFIMRFTDALDRLGFVSDSDREKPTQPMTVYRAGIREGIAWTTDVKIATFFAERFATLHGRRTIYRATCPPSAVYALVDGRNEHEVLVKPWRLIGVTETEL